MRVVDLFCGGGGASEGIRMALGVDVELAVNHSPAAIRMHSANHPNTRHIQGNVWGAYPVRALSAPESSMPPSVDLLWASPDCRHFSKARGGKPKEKGIRDLPWVILQWVHDVRPTVIGMENVAEILTWGPLDEEGRVIKERAGETWEEFVGELRGAGYQVDWRVLNAADYGAPTSRRRLFMVARCDGEPVAWPEPTHGPGCPEPYRTAAEHIDWNIPTPSIFLNRDEAKAWAKDNGRRPPKRPLADNTLRRIATGVKRFVLEAQRPFLLNLTHGGRLEPITDPLRTITGAHRGEKAVVVPSIARIGHTSSGAKVYPVEAPITTVTSKNEHLLVNAHLTKFYGTSIGAEVDQPEPTITGQGQHLGLVVPSMVQVGYGERAGQAPRVLDLHAPLGTVPASGNKFAMVQAFLAKHNGGATGQQLAEPLHTITGTDTKALVSAWLMKYYGTSVGQAVDAPMDTVVSKARFAAVTALLSRFTDYDGPAEAATLNIGGEVWAIADIGMRMLTPRELSLCQGFPAEYLLEGTKTEKIARIGNSVPPQVVAAVVGAQFPERVQRAAA